MRIPHSYTVSAALARIDVHWRSCLVALGPSTILGTWLCISLATAQPTPPPFWQTDGTAVCTATGNQREVASISDGAGGTILVWEDTRNGSDADIYAERLDPLGQPLWGWGAGIPICRAAGDQYQPVAVLDNDPNRQGVIFAWVDQRSGYGLDDVYAERIWLNSQPDPNWPQNGAVVCNDPATQWMVTAAAHSDSGAVIVWSDSRSMPDDIYVQYMCTGSPVWTANGIAVSTPGAGISLNPAVISDGSQGVIIAWRESDLLHGPRCPRNDQPQSC